MSCSPYDMLIYNKFLTLPQYKEINRFLNCELLHFFSFKMPIFNCV